MLPGQAFVAERGKFDRAKGIPRVSKNWNLRMKDQNTENRSVGKHTRREVLRILAGAPAGEEARGIKWTAAMPDLGSKICELLDIRFTTSCWQRGKKLKRCGKVLEDSKQTPEKVVYLDLAEHSIDYETKPFIDVKIKSASVKKLTLTVLLNLKVKGFVLKVQNGAIRELQTGNCEAKGSIRYGTLSIAEKKLEPIKFPSQFRFPV